MKTLLLALTLLLPPQDPAEKAIDQAVTAYARIKTAKATFEQTITNALTGTALRSRGEFEQERPNKFAFRFTDPRGDLIVSDGKHLWMYLPSSAPGQVLRAPLAAEAAGSLDLIGEFFTNPRARYAISDGGAASIDGHAVRIVVLAPKSRDAAFTRARVWIDTSNGTLRQFEAEEASGVTRTVRITSFTPNARVNAAAFVYKPGRGIRVVDQQTLRR